MSWYSPSSKTKQPHLPYATVVYLASIKYPSSTSPPPKPRVEKAYPKWLPSRIYPSAHPDNPRPKTSLIAQNRPQSSHVQRIPWLKTSPQPAAMSPSNTKSAVSFPFPLPPHCNCPNRINQADRGKPPYTAQPPRARFPPILLPPRHGPHLHLRPLPDGSGDPGAKVRSSFLPSPVFAALAGGSAWGDGILLELSMRRAGVGIGLDWHGMARNTGAFLAFFDRIERLLKS